MSVSEGPAHVGECVRVVWKGVWLRAEKIREHHDNHLKKQPSERSDTRRVHAQLRTGHKHHNCGEEACHGPRHQVG